MTNNVKAKYADGTVVKATDRKGETREATIISSHIIRGKAVYAIADKDGNEALFTESHMDFVKNGSIPANADQDFAEFLLDMADIQGFPSDLLEKVSEEEKKQNAA